MRLIDIEAVLKAAELAGKEYVSIDFLKDFEQVEAVPVVRGEWLNIPNRYVCVAGDRPYHGNATSCSVCHDINPNAFKTNFCPNCGADMREE